MKYAFFIVSLFCFGILVVGEIHRARPTSRLITGKEYTLKRCTTGKDLQEGKCVSNKVNQILSWTPDKPWFSALIGAALVGLSGVFPLLVISLETGAALKTESGAQRLSFLLSFAVGGLLGDVFLHLLPEAWAHVSKDDPHACHNRIAMWVLAGILGFMIIEKIFGESEGQEFEDSEGEDSIENEEVDDLSIVKELMGNHIHFTDGKDRKLGSDWSIHSEKKVAEIMSLDDDYLRDGTMGYGEVLSGEHYKDIVSTTEEPGIMITGWLNLIANCVDNFTHGLAVGGSFLVSHKVGVVTTFAILMHEIPHEVGDFAILLKSGFDRSRAAKAQMLTASCGMIGAAVALMSDSAENAGNRTAWVLPFTAGGFLYISLVTVLPDILKKCSLLQTVLQLASIFAGIGSMMLVTSIFEGFS